MRTTLPQLHRDILTKAKAGYFPTRADEKAAIVKLQARGFVKRKTIPGTFGVGRLAVTNPFGYQITPSGKRALVGDAEPLTPLAKREKKADRMSRTACRKIVLDRCNGLCEIIEPGCTVKATEVHEVKSRGRGGSARDPNNCKGACHNCNQRVHNRPKEAMAKGHLATGHVHIIQTTTRPFGGVGASIL